MAVWKNRVPADPTLEEERTEDKSKRFRRVEKPRSSPTQYTRCYSCWERISVDEKVDPDEAIDLHRKTSCRKAKEREHDRG